MAVAALVAGVAGCASLQSSGTSGESRPAPPTSFAHRVASAQVVLYWDCARPEPGLLRLDGLAQNPWAAQDIRSLEFELVGMDGRDRIVSDVKGEARDFSIRTNQFSPFRLELRPAGSEVRFDLYYQYQFDEGEQMDALLAGPPMVPSPLLARMSQRFLVRDACSDTQHRAR